MYIILAIIIGLCATGIFILQKVLKNTFAMTAASPQEAYNGKYYICFLIVQLDFDDPQILQIADFSKYDDHEIVYLRSSARGLEDMPASLGLSIEEATTPTIVGWVELFELEEGLWKWRRLSS